jgi:hypothetical protein
LLAQEMELWGGSIDGSIPGPATFSKVDPNGNLFIVYDVNRPEPDDDWNGCWLCINPGQTGSTSIPTIWRRITDDAGFKTSTGAMTLTSALPSSAYAATTMTYELFRMFKPEQWMNAVNYAIRNAYPQRHRLVVFEAPEDPNTMFYDWAHLASQASLVNPSGGPTVTAIADPGGQTNIWAAGTYKVAYNLWNANGETLVSPTSSVTLSAGQVLQISTITVPEQAIGVNYFCTPDPGGSLLAQFSLGSGVMPSPNPDNVVQQIGIADPTTFIVPAVQFWGPPGRLARTNPAFNTSTIDTTSLSLKTVKRRVNPGQFPERYIDLNPNWWREVGGTTIKLEMKPLKNYSLHFECMAIARTLSGESDSSEEPLEILIAGGQLYLWNLLLMTGSAQNVQAWEAEVKKADDRFKKARNLHQMPGPRKTMRRPNIYIARWWSSDV